MFAPSNWPGQRDLLKRLKLWKDTATANKSRTDLSLPDFRNLKMHVEIQKYNRKLSAEYREICELLASEIDSYLKGAESKIWHAHPDWFLEGNPVVGYSPQKPGLRLMFWSGAGFEEEGLNVVGKKFKDASIFYNDVKEIKKTHLRRWLKKAKTIQYNYRDIRKSKGQTPLLVKAKGPGERG